MTLAQQIQSDIESKLTRKRLQIAEKRILEKMDEIKNRQTQSGKSPAKGGRWNNLYNEKYAREAKNGRLKPVTMRQREISIEKTRIIGKKDKSTLKFENRRKGIIFAGHHTGRTKGGKIRQIYPNKDSQVPLALDKVAENAVFKLLQ